MKSIALMLNILLAVAALIVAYLWWRASVDLVRSDYDGQMASDYGSEPRLRFTTAAPIG